MGDTTLLWNKEGALKRMMGKQALLDKIIDLFLAQFPQVWTSAKSAVANSNWKEVASQAHTLKGSAAELGLERLADALRVLEHAARTEDETSAIKAQVEVDAVVEKTLPLLTR
ncbi:Hpt domain-containing protein [Alteromonas sp. H39]|uniref:Hpt domain-containing protein n=1 Tax=Alteromonas sp. H39 TaxID=3389876 RepID=UPI0039E00D48